MAKITKKTTYNGYKLQPKLKGGVIYMEKEEIIFRMSFRTKNGKIVYAKNGHPFPIPIKNKE